MKLNIRKEYGSFFESISIRLGEANQHFKSSIVINKVEEVAFKRRNKSISLSSLFLADFHLIVMRTG
jgi:hypothetical protein